MKRFIGLIFILLLFVVSVHGQLAVVDATANAILTNSFIEQTIRYAQILADNAHQIMQTYALVQNMVHQTQMAMQNLRTIGDISSWSDFMDFYNRQLYLERRTLETFQHMNVSIGDRNFHLTDIEGIITGTREQTRDFWENEFTEDQRRAMWLELGLTPSNYAFVQPFRAKALEIAREGLAAREIQNDWYWRNMTRNNERLRRLMLDQYLPEDDQLGDKELQMYILESLMESNKVLNDIAMQNAAMLELLAVQHYLSQTPTDIPPFANWSEYGFVSLTPEFEW